MTADKKNLSAKNKDIPINILIVEDSEDDTRLLLNELQMAGFAPAWKRVETKTDYLANLGPQLDVIFSDFHLPQFSTVLALELLQQSHLEIPFIIVSGTIGEERAVESLKAGATDYVLKDRMQRLVPAVRRALREARERAERQEAEKNLTEVRKQLDHILAHSPAVIYSFKVEDNIFRPVWISENINQFLGHAGSENGGRALWLSSIHPDDRKEALGGESRVLQHGHAVKEYRLRDKNGNYHWVRDEQKLVLDADGQPSEIVGSWIDITEQKQFEEQFHHAQKLESIGQLAGGIAHDFNNILTVIQGHASLLLSEPPVRDVAGESLEIINHAAERAAMLTRQLLMFSRKQVMRPKLLDLNQIVADLTKMLHRLLGANISLQANYSPRLSRIRADAGMMEQVLMNLAVNACDAMPSGGELIIRTADETIGVEYVEKNPQATAGNHVCLTVTDTGCGIPAENILRVFEPFFTTKEVGRGTGLGLATVYGIVKQHHGWITIDSEVGKGTTFRIFLPMADETQKDDGIAHDGAPAPHGTETILLVEDEPAVRSLARDILRRQGYKILEADCGAAALKLWQTDRDKIDLVLTDIIMPGMNGHHLVEKLHAEKPSLPVIFTSGYSADIAGKDFELVEGVNFLQKPFTPLKVAQALRRVLDQARKPV